MRQAADSTSKALPAEIRHAPGAPSAQPRTIQPRRYQRRTFRIPVCIQQGPHQTFGETMDFTPGGLRLLCRNAPALTPGSALSLTVQFGETCNLSAAAQMVYCQVSPLDQTCTMGVRFAGLRDWEQTILLSALKELSESDRSRQASLITIHASENTLAREAVALAPEPPQPSFVATEPIIGEPPSLHPERRMSPRLAVRALVDIKFDDVLYKATLHDVSLSGLYLTSEMPLSVHEHQPVQLGFASDIGVLDIRGTIRGIHEDAREQGTGVSTSVLGLAIHYPSLDPVEGAVLASILNEIREHPSALKLTVLLLPLETGDLLLELDAANADATDATPVHPGQSHQAEEREHTGHVTSTLLEHHNAQGQRIVLYHDHPEASLPPETPIMIIVPGYGETKKEHIALAYHLAANGFQVLRYDHTNHVGESEGDILHSTLSSMQQDLHAMLDYAERMWPQSPITVIATSLSGRVALKTAAEDARIKLLVLLAGVVDVQATLLAVHQEDLIGTHRKGVRRGVINVLGFNIHADDWLEDAIKGDYADLDTTRSDIGRVHGPVVLFTAEHDAWVPLKSVQTVLSSLPADSSHLYLIPEALHRLHENPRKARSVFRQISRFCLEKFCSPRPAIEVREAVQSEVARQSKIERERARTRHRMGKAENVEFWRDYLAHFHYISNVSDFWRLLDRIYRLAGPFAGGERILDAGCGNGNFAMFLLINQGYSQRNVIGAIPRPLVYVGIDFVPAALDQARLNIEHVSHELRGKLSQALIPSSLLRTAFGLSDLNLPLPFRDHQFDRIICNLVLSYLQDPLFTLREFMRVLSPGGRLVLTNLKPQADLSQVYRNFVCTSQRPEELDEARQLLSNSGKIKQRESDGVFSFLSKDELATLLTSAGALQPRVYSAFANQAFIAAAEKQR